MSSCCAPIVFGQGGTPGRPALLVLRGRKALRVLRVQPGAARQRERTDHRRSAVSASRWTRPFSRTRGGDGLTACVSDQPGNALTTVSPVPLDPAGPSPVTRLQCASCPPRATR